MLLLVGLFWAMGQTASLVVGDGYGPVVQARPLKPDPGASAKGKGNDVARNDNPQASAATKARRSDAPIGRANGNAWDADSGNSEFYSDDDGSGDDSDGDDCSDNYSGCLPAGEYDVDCGEVSDTDIDVIGVDEYALDRDGDGIACESY